MSKVLWESSPLAPPSLPPRSLPCHPLFTSPCLCFPNWGRSCQPGGEPGKVWILEENWAGARTAELVPSLPGAAGITRLGSWFRVSLEGPAFWVERPQAPKGGRCCRRAKCPGVLHQRPHSAPSDRKSLGLVKMGPAQGQRARQWLRNRKRCVCV